jgi:hypothetical protein
MSIQPQFPVPSDVILSNEILIRKLFILLFRINHSHHHHHFWKKYILIKIQLHHRALMNDHSYLQIIDIKNLFMIILPNQILTYNFHFPNKSIFAHKPQCLINEITVTCLIIFLIKKHFILKKT